MIDEYAHVLTLLKEKIDTLKKLLDYEEKSKEAQKLEEKMSAPLFWERPDEAQEIFGRLKEIKEDVASLAILLKRQEELTLMLELIEDESDKNQHLAEIARDIETFKEQVHLLESQSMLQGPDDKANAIVSIHAGAGGTESCDWAEMLLRMYRRWVERRSFEDSITEILPGDEAGVKSCTVIVKGSYAYGYLKAEKGVHRLVRISPFDSNRRRHTSFVSVDVIPERENIAEIIINDDDLRIDTYRSSGAGGQHVNKTDSAVRITHIPTGTVVACQNERSQHKNKALALKILKSRLYDIEHKKREEEQAKNYAQKGDIGWGNQIRSYVFHPYQMVKDHRCAVETSNTQAVMDGDIDLFIEAFLKMKR
ncbi:peptide chain release factor 2 [Chlamydiota bacterium]